MTYHPCYRGKQILTAPPVDGKISLASLPVFDVFVVQSLGNHELDLDLKGLNDYLKGTKETFPIVVANLFKENSTTEELRQNGLKKSTILTFNDVRVGVVGYLTTEVKTLAVIDEVRAIK